MKCLPSIGITVFLHKIILILWVSIVSSKEVGNWTLQRRWVSSNFGSTLAASPVFSDFNRDGHLDAVILSFDGELSVLDITRHGELIAGSDWPAYHHGHHFFSSPILFDVEHDGVEEIAIISFSGSIFIYTWRGALLFHTKLSKFNLTKKMLLSPEAEVLKTLNSKQRRIAEPVVELQPEVYSSPLLIDLNADGRKEELVFLTNYGVMQKTSMKREYNLIFATKIVFNLTSLSPISEVFIECRKRQSEFPAYFLSDPVVFIPQGKVPHVAATSASGKLFIWRGMSLENASGFPYEYGPSLQSPNIIWLNGTAAVVVLDYWGNILALDLTGKQVWEQRVKGSPTNAKRWFLEDQETLVLGTDQGFVYALSASDGRPLTNFPVSMPGLSFSSSPLLMTTRGDQHFAGFLSRDSDKFAVLDLRNPKDYFQTNFMGEKSHLGPSLLPHKLTDSCPLFLPLSDGAVGCYSPQTLFVSGASSAYQVVELFPYQSLSIYLGADINFGGSGSTLYVYGHVATVVLHISDRLPNHHYAARIYLSGQLLHVKELQRSGFHYFTFNLTSNEVQGLLVVELQSLLSGETARDHLWLQRPNFFHRNQFLFQTFFISFVCIFFFFICLHIYRHRSFILDQLDFGSRWYRKFKRKLRPSTEPFLPLCYRPSPTTAPWRRPITATFLVVRKLYFVTRDLCNRIFSRRKSRLY